MKAQGKIFTDQPESCRAIVTFAPIPVPTWMSFPERHQAINRLSGYDPGPIYAAHADQLDCFKRTQSGLAVRDLFPERPDGLCVCGCGEKARRYYARHRCGTFVNVVFEILYGRSATISRALQFMAGNAYVCAVEGCGGSQYLDVDHIVAVKHGGGASWLSNYQHLCKSHHQDKTNQDFGHGRHRKTNQQKLL